MNFNCNETYSESKKKLLWSLLDKKLPEIQMHLTGGTWETFGEWKPDNFNYLPKDSFYRLCTITYI
jgi:hypothetical protein